MDNAIESHEDARRAFSDLRRLKQEVSNKHISIDEIECIHFEMEDIFNELNKFIPRTEIKLVVDNTK